MTPPRYLFGPVGPGYADDNLHRARAAGHCLAFDASPGADLVIRHGDRWSDIAARLPPGWRPDFIALMLPYTAVPPGLFAAPLPLIGLAADWHLLWHRYRGVLPRCDAVVTDAWGVERLQRAGMPAMAGNLFGCARSFLDAPASDAPRDIDILYVGSLHPAEQRERLPWLRRVAMRFSSRWKIVIRGGLDREGYQAMLRRSRIVFNRGVRRECNLRCFEAAAMGALLFQEAGNMEVRRYFRDGAECVFYDEDTLDGLLAHYLGHEPDRARIAAAARARVASFGYADLWDETVQAIGRRLPELWHRALLRARGPVPEGTPIERMWESLCCHTGDDRLRDPEPGLIAELREAVRRQPDAGRCNVLALAIARHAQRLGRFERDGLDEAVGALRQSVELAPWRPLLRLNLAEAWWHAGRDADALRECRQALGLLDGAATLHDDDLDAGHFPPAYDSFRVEWERATWQHAGAPRAEGDAKLRLLRWRLHGLVAALSDDLAHYRQAASLRSDLWTSQAALGRALLRSKLAPEACGPLRRATELNPFDPELGRDYLAALRASGHREARRAFLAERRSLRRATSSIAAHPINFAQEVTR